MFEDTTHEVGCATYETHDSFGRMIKTHTNPSKDKSFVRAMNVMINMHLPTIVHDSSILTNSVNFQQKFISAVELSLDSISDMSRYDGSLYKELKCDLFSSMKDLSGRPISRFVLTDDTKTRRYIVDVFSSMQVHLKVSGMKRTLLKILPYGWMNLKQDEFVPRINYIVRIWNSPYTCYTMENIYSTYIDVPYSHKVDRLCRIMGIPNIYDKESVKEYERIDYYTRRMLFNEESDVLKSRADGQGQGAPDREHHLCKR